MKKLISLLAIFAAVCSGIAAYDVENNEVAAASGVSWIKNYDQGMRKAKSTGKPVFLYFR